MGIQSIPAVIAFVNGQPVDGFLGALPEGQVTDFIARITKDKLGGEEQDLLKSAEEALAAGNADERDRRSTARCCARSRTTCRRSPGLRAPMSRPASSIRRRRRSRWCPRRSATKRPSRRRASALEVAEQAQSVGPVGELEQKVAANPLDHQARFDLAVALNAAGKRQEAADHLIEIVKRDRKWNDDGARKQLVQFFEAWGPTDEATVNGRRKLSSMLFS